MAFIARTAAIEAPTGELPARERRLWLILIWLTAVAYVCGVALGDPDLWGHTLYGVRSIEQGVLTERTDPFSYTVPGTEWVNHEWLTEYQLGWLWLHAGQAGLCLWRDAWAIAMFAAAAVAIRHHRAGLFASAVLLLFGAATLSHYMIFVRPQMATFALFAWTLLILRRHWDRPDSKAIWLLPLLTAIWTNQHGGFLAGIGVIFVFVCGWAVRAWKDRSERAMFARVCAVGALSLAATLLNPYGAHMHAMLLHHLGSAQDVREWQSLWEAGNSPTYYPPFVLIALALALSRRWSWIDLAVIGVVGWQATSHLRHIALLAIVMMLLIPAPLTDAFGRLMPRLQRGWSVPGRWRRRAVAVAAVVLLCGSMMFQSSYTLWRCGIGPWDVAVQTRDDCPAMPVGALEVLRREHVSGNIITDYGWAQFVIWHTFPQSHVAFDGRYRTIYPPRQEAQFVDFVRGGDPHGKIAMLDDYPTEIAILSTTYGPWRTLRQRPDWMEIYHDEQAHVFVRRIPKFSRVIAEAETSAIPAPKLPLWRPFPGL
jgi:hypothetical protein